MQKSDLFMGFLFPMGFREISMPETGPILHNPIYIFQTEQNVSNLTFVLTGMFFH